MCETYLQLRHASVSRGTSPDRSCYLPFSAHALVSALFLSCCLSDGINDERVVCMAAEALTLVLNGHGGCRVAWARQGNFLGLSVLMRYVLVVSTRHRHDCIKTHISFC